MGQRFTRQMRARTCGWPMLDTLELITKSNAKSERDARVVAGPTSSGEATTRSGSRSASTQLEPRLPMLI